MFDILFLLLAAGVPYYLILEKMTNVSSKTIFIISGLSLLSAVILSLYIPNEHKTPLVVISFLSALISIYKATQTTNFYKLGYYLIFINAPFFILFEDAGAMYSFSLLVSLMGLFLIANFYNKNYGSANYKHITGITLKTPCVSTFLSIYLIALALYPPFPNSFYFLSHIFNSEPNALWYLIVTTLFFANFALAMRVMRATLFGRPHSDIHYTRMNLKDKLIHIFMLVFLLVLTAFGLKEALL